LRFDRGAVRRANAYAYASELSVRDGSTLPGWPLILRRELAAQYLGLSPSTFDTEVKGGRIPKPVKMTETIKGWHRGDLDAWAEDRRHASDNVPNPWDSAA